jgi:hypothetical protein
LISGIWVRVKTKVIGRMANTLKVTQVSVETERQTISLRMASPKKNSPQRSVSLRQPSSVSWKTVSKT